MSVERGFNHSLSLPMEVMEANRKGKVEAA